jgi:hypothetical protein
MTPTEEELKAAGITLIEEGRFGEYHGSLIEDCLSVIKNQAQTPHDVGDGKLQKRERQMGGYYSGENQ